MNRHRHLIEEEIFAIRHSGEMPEVALHTGLYDLQEDPAGPRMAIAPGDLRLLKDAVEARYKRIIMRDLDPRLRNHSIYRGLARAMANWQRLVRFCTRENRDTNGHRREVADALLNFLATETADVAGGRAPSAVNCTAAELAAFAGTLGLAPAALPKGWQKTCAKGNGPGKAP
ncbi:MAG: hypothetical protein PVJ53_10295 [Desulfobacterales bacterium]|jgi:hypothetical protein